MRCTAKAAGIVFFGLLCVSVARPQVAATQPASDPVPWADTSEEKDELMKLESGAWGSLDGPVDLYFSSEQIRAREPALRNMLYRELVRVGDVTFLKFESKTNRPEVRWVNARRLIAYRFASK